MNYTGYCDGAVRKPGASCAFVVYENGKEIYREGKFLGKNITNNQAEYHSLRLGLEEAQKMGAREVAVHMDSLLVVNQMKGIFKVKNRDLWPIHGAIKQLVRSFEHVAFKQIPRELNKLADSAVNRTLDDELKNSSQKLP